MDTSGFSTSRDEIAVLDFAATMTSKSASSISFHLGKWGNSLQLDDMDEPRVFGDRTVFNVFGWADVHHPCEGHIKTWIRVVVPNDYMKFDQQREIVLRLMNALCIPGDETYEAFFVSPDRQESIEQPVDRNGITDRT